MKKTFSRALSVILAVLMLASAMPFAFATTELSEANITVWPEVTGTCYYGQAIGDGFTVSGGEVQYNGTVVTGRFEFNNPNATSNPKSNYIAEYRFIPDEEMSYSSFVTTTTNENSPKLTISKGIPNLQDENNPPVASEVEPGATLSTSTISGGTMIDKYSNKVLSVGASKWKWTDSTTVVNESGYYDATFKVMGTYLRFYDTATTKIYVKVKGDVPEIIEYPSIETLTYNPNITWADVEIKGGKAVVSGTENEVLGTFSIKDEWKDITPYVGEYKIDINFTPVDKKIDAVNFEIPVVVSTAPITFETEDGTGVPTITVDYGKKTNDDMGLMLKQYVPEDVQIQYIDFYGLDGQLLEHANKIYDPGTYTLTCRGLTQNKNYATTMLTFNLVVNPITITPAIEGNGNRMIIRDVKGQYNPKGTFDLYINDELVKEDIPYNEYFTWEHTTSGDKNFKAVYKPGDDNRYEIDPTTRNDTGIILEWNVVANNTEIAPKKYAYNSAVTLVAPAYDPATPDKPYYGFAGWEDVNGNTGLAEEQLKNAEITFTMPDADVELKATYKFSIKLFFEWVLAQITQFFTFIVNAVKDLIALA